MVFIINITFPCSLLHLASRSKSSTGVDWGSIAERNQSSRLGKSAGSETKSEDGSTSLVGQQMTKKFQTFIRCSVKLLISCGNKHKNFLEAHSSLLQDIVSQLITNVEEELSIYEGKIYYKR